MAGRSDKYDLFLSLIREYASEKTEEELRVDELKKRIEELRSELEVANAELENVKRDKETSEQELKGCEVELSLNETSIQTLEARISMLQGEIASAGSELEGLKNEAGATRDLFVNRMLDLNHKIREYQERFSCNNEESYELEGDDTKDSSRSVEERLVRLVCQLATEEEDHRTEQNIQNRVRQELVDLQKRLSKMEMIVKGTKEMQDLTRAGLEELFARFSEELQNRCLCPQCKQDNMEALDNIPQVNETT